MSDFKIVKLTDPIQFTNVAGGLVPRGAYNPATSYSVGDSVSYTDGNSYVLYASAPAGTLPTDTTKWQLLAQKGNPGTPGTGITDPTKMYAVTNMVASTTSSGTLVKQTKYSFDATAGNISWALPTTGTLGDIIVVQKSDATANTVAVTGKINGTASNTATVRTQNQAKFYQFDGVDNWNIVAGDISVTALDSRYTLAGTAGNVVGPGASTDNDVVRWDGTTGTLIQDSAVSIDDTGNTTVGGTLTVNNSAAASTGLSVIGAQNIVNTSTSNSVGSTLNFRTATTINRAAIAGYRDSSGSGGNLRLYYYTGTTLTEGVRLLSSGLLGVGTTAPTAKLEVNGDVNWGTAGNVAATSYISAYQGSNTAVAPSLQMLGTTAPDSSLINARFQNNGNAAGNIYVKSRGASVGTHGILQNNDLLGNILWDGDDGVNYIEGARIRARVEGTPAAGSMPAALDFYTNPGGVDVASLAMVIHPDNSVAIGYGSNLQSTTLAVNGTAFFNGVVGGSDPTLNNHFTTKLYVDVNIPGGHNLITNPSFESGTGAPFGVANGATLTSSTAQARTGTKSALIGFATTVSDNGARIFQGTLTANKTYIATAWVYVPSGSPPPNGVRLSIQANSLLPLTNTSTAYTTTNYDNWIQLQAVFQTTATTTTVSAYVISNNTTSGQLCYLDDVALQDGWTGLVTTTDGAIWNASVASNITFADGANIVSQTSTGMKIGTSATQKLGFFNATPVAQQSATGDIGTILSNLGLRASGTAYPITTAGATTLTGLVTLGGNGFKSTPSTRTAAVTLATTSAWDNLCNATTASFAITLPLASAGTGQRFWFKKIDATVNTITITCAGSDTIDGVATYVLSTQYKYVEIVSNGTVWYVRSNN